MFRFIVLACVLVSGLCAPTDYDDLDLPNLGIVGGYEVDVGHFPHQVSLEYSTRHFCGGSIINKRTIITAAHCTTISFLRDHIYIRAGVTKFEKDGVYRKVEKIFDHPKYNPANYDYDISVLILSEPLDYNSNIQPIELQGDSSKAQPGEYAVVSGWGHTAENGEASEHLKMVYVPFVSDEKCKTFYGSTRITEAMLCAGFDDGKEDACQGDSGGPLVHDNKLTGVVSWGVGCARAGKPGVYTKVSHVINWVHDTIKNNL